MTDRVAPANSPLADDAARRLARERFDVPVLLEAGAGTGKTTALVARLLSWLLDAGWRAAEAEGPPSVPARALDGVVAITFTDAAAAEMASRLADELAKIAAGGFPLTAPELAERVPATELRARAAALGAELGRARLSTIHAFCRSLLAAHPFEADVHPAFTVDADADAAERTVFETVSARFAERFATDDADWLALFADGHDAEALSGATLTALQACVSAEELARDPFVAEAIDARFAEVRPPLAALSAALAIAAPRARGGAPANVLAALGPLTIALVRETSPVSVESASRLADALWAANGDSLKEWARGKSTKTIEEALPPGVDFRRLAAEARIALESLRELRPEELARRRRVVGALVGEARARLDREGYLLYEDLLDRATRLLTTKSEVRRAVRRGIRQLLVDEFQDTDQRQCALVAALALDGAEDERPGLFVVGDPKQSIYGWRDADLAAYGKFMDQARAAGALSARLSVNFRSTPQLLDEVARAVGPAFVAEVDLQPEFVPLLPSPRGIERGEACAGEPAVEYWFSLDPDAGRATRSRQATAIEARAVATDLLASRARHPDLEWRDFALLARTGTELESYLEALRQAGIPFAVERDRSYWHRREVIDAAALVRSVIEPGDTLALLALLRSPFVGVPDAAWQPLWAARFPELVARFLAPDADRLRELAALVDAVAAALPSAEIPGLARIEGWEKSAAAALEALGELRGAFGRESAERFVERLRARFAPEPIAAARFLGQFGVANLERFFRELEAALDRSGDDPAAVARLLRQAVAERRPAEEAKPPAAGADAVRVATIHRAKGLEFEVVYLLQAHKGEGGDRNDPPLAVDRRGGTVEYRLLGLRTPGWSAVCRRRTEIAERERVRLLYVAATRAKRRLVVLGQPFGTRGSEKSLLPLLEARWAGARAAQSPVYPYRDAHGVLWRAPALEADWSREAARATRAPTSVDDATRVAAELDVLTTRRAVAAARSARPRFERASDLGGFEADDEPRTEEEVSSASQDKEERRKASIEGVGDRAFARARGVALHRALELQLLAASDAGAWCERVRASFLLERPTADAAEIEALSSDADRLRLSLLWKQLSLLSDRNRIEARELPLLLAADAQSSIGPTEGFVGTLDLLYRDLDSGELVVADFKSDEILAEASIAAKVAAYGPQLELYGRAVCLALGLEQPPRLELWLLGADRVVPIR